MLRLPKSTPEASLGFELTTTPGSETWVRRFPSRTMRSQLTMRAGIVVERVGPVTFHFELQACEGRLLMLLRKAMAFGVPLPQDLMPELRAEETGAAGRLHFDVAAALPGVGRIVAYRGSLPVPPSDDGSRGLQRQMFSTIARRRRQVDSDRTHPVNSTAAEPLPAADPAEDRFRLYAWMRLGVSLLLLTIGSGSMYIVVVVLPALQAELGITRADASLPYTMTMVGFGVGGLIMGRLADRFGVMLPLLIGAVSLGLGFTIASAVESIVILSLVHGVLIGLFGSSALFAPLIADTSLWFTRRRGIAVAICASGNYVAGAVWPPIVQHFVLHRRLAGNVFRYRHLQRRQPDRARAAHAPSATRARRRDERDGGARAAFATLRLSPRAAQALLCLAGLACCVAMSMPQVHIVAYCGDLGYGVARGAQMLALMLAFGVVSRLVSGAICDRIGGLRTLLLGSALQAVALLLFLPFDGLVSLFVISALFGLFQGGIVPAYAIIVREHFSPAEAGSRMGTVLMFTLFGMALGGWMSGEVFDLTGSYRAAFLNGIAWNALNLTIALFLLGRIRRQGLGGLASASTR